MRFIGTILLSTTALLAVGCSQGGEGESAPAEVAATGEPTAAAGMAAGMNDPANPFAQDEMQMQERMMAANGVNASDAWTRKMIEHHRGAVTMSQTVLGQNPTPEVRQAAQMTIDKQTREIADLEKLVQQGETSPETGQYLMPVMTRMHEAMMAAKGANVSETWMRKMIAHHQGAVDMSDAILAQGADARIRDKVVKTKEDQQKEIAMLERMLRGEPMRS